MSKAEDAVAQGEASVRAWLVRLRSGDATTEDLEAFRRWCETHPDEARFVPTMGDIWGKLAVAAAEVARLPAQPARAAAPANGWRSGRRAFVGFAVAAGASWLALRPPLHLWPALGELAADYRTGTGEQRRVALSDRVTVQMNTQTRIDVLGAGPAPNGIELLAGEAEISAVASPHGGPEAASGFEVVAASGRIRARTATLNVRRSGDEVCVTCLSGAVTVAHRRQPALALAAGQQLRYDRRAVQRVVQVDASTVTAWRRGLLVFDDVALAQVIDEINRYRPGKVILDNPELGRRKIRAQFFIARLDEGIGMISELYGARVTRLPGHITLLS